jgi:hypothetical protein
MSEDEYIGKVQSFRIGKRMIAFEVIRQSGSIITIRSLDLEYQAQILTDKWIEQERRLKLARSEICQMN